MRALVPLLFLVACSREQPAAPPTPGARLEAAAVARGLVADANGGSPVGSWSNESDRLCVVPAGRAFRVGVGVDYGEGQACAGSGVAERRGDRLDVSLGECRFVASYDGDRITFPATLPGACDRLCTGRASLTALTVDRLSGSASEAATLRSLAGKSLCGS